MAVVPLPPPPPRPFGLQALGWACIVGCALLLVLVIFMAVSVVRTMTSPQPFLKEYLDSGLVEAQPIAGSMAVALEYESLAVRSQSIQVSYGFAAGLVFLAVGLLLFATATVSAFQISGKSSALELTVSTAAPGLLPMVIGGILIGLAVNKPVNRHFTTSLDVPEKTRIESDFQRPPHSDKGLVEDRKSPGASSKK